jgi:hypothetical protein
MILNSNNCDGFFSSVVESERVLPCPDVAWVSVPRLSVERTAAVNLLSGLHVLKHREG